MKRFVLLCAAVFFICGNVIAQRSPKMPIGNNAVKELLQIDWSEHGGNVLKRHKTTLKDTIVFDFNYKEQLEDIADYNGSNLNGSRAKAIVMPNNTPKGNYPMTIFLVDTTATYAARIYKY